MNVVTCSRCAETFRALYEGQGDGCCCHAYLKIDEDVEIEGEDEAQWELPPFWVSQAADAYAQGHLSAGYGSRHDMMTFAFVHPCEGQPELTREEVMQRYEWATPEEINVCDDCVDDLLAAGELVVISDPLGDMQSAFEETQLDALNSD